MCYTISNHFFITFKLCIFDKYYTYNTNTNTNINDNFSNLDNYDLFNLCEKKL